jgi:TadE-like protein
MRKLMVKIIQLLDGTPAVYGKRQSGQSVVELALITPILIILLAGLVEIGWFANNYLNLLDVTRVGARRGAVLQDQKSPLFWDNKYTYVPNVMLPTNYQMAQGPVTMPDGTVQDNGTDTERFTFRWMPAGSTVPGNKHTEACDPAYVDRAFYNEVICTMLTTMDPLTLNQTNGIDDIVVSGFSLQKVDATAHPTWLANSYDKTVPQIVVAGRYPTNANECDVLNPNNSGTISMASRPGDGRDPFDFNGNGARDIAPPDLPNSPTEVAGTFTELAGYDSRVTTGGDVSHLAEKQVGFSLFGNHKIPETWCVGSEWTISRVESLMNLSSYGLTSATDREYIPSQGLVLVEIYWEHEMLLKIPVLSPVFSAVGNAQGKMVINVWAAFPLASVEPHVIFPSP